MGFSGGWPFQEDGIIKSKRLERRMNSVFKEIGGQSGGWRK